MPCRRNYLTQRRPEVFSGIELAGEDDRTTSEKMSPAGSNQIPATGTHGRLCCQQLPVFKF